MTDDFDASVKRGLAVVVSAAPELGPAPDAADASQTASQGRRRSAVLTAAAAAVAAVLFFAVAGAGDRDSIDVQTSSEPGLVLPSSGVDAQSFAVWAGDAEGAVVGPDGTVLGLSVFGEQALDTVPPGIDRRSFGAVDAWAAPDGSAPTQTRRGVMLGCATLSIVTGVGPAWSADVEAVVGSASVAEAGISVSVPDGWRSLGAAQPGPRYSARLVSQSADDPFEVWLRQAPGAPLGVFLSSPETNPVEIAGSGSLWFVRGGTTAGWNTIVGSVDGTAVELAGLVAVDRLREIFDSLAPVSSARWLDEREAPSTGSSSADEAGASCAVEKLWIDIARPEAAEGELQLAILDDAVDGGVDEGVMSQSRLPEALAGGRVVLSQSTEDFEIYVGRSPDGVDVCIILAGADASSAACGPAGEVVSSALWIMSSVPGEPTRLAVLVPDGSTAAVINGRPVEIVNNTFVGVDDGVEMTFSYTLPEGEVVTRTVGE